MRFETTVTGAPSLAALIHTCYGPPLGKLSGSWRVMLAAQVTFGVAALPAPAQFGPNGSP